MRQVTLSHWFLQDCILLDTRNTVANRGPYSQSYGFPVVMYGCESWTVKKAEHQELTLSNWEDSWESLGLQGNQTSQS